MMPYRSLTHTPYRLLLAIPGFLFVTSLCAAPVPVETSTLDKSIREDGKFGLGATLSVAQRPFVGVDNQDTSLPYLSFRYRDFYIEGLNIGYTLVTQNNFSLELLATPRFYEVEPSFADNGELDGIDNTRPTYFAGVSTQFTQPYATFTLQLLTDLRESDGNEAVATVSRAFKPGSDVTLAPTLGLTYQDADLVDHFYGVQSHESNINRPEYKGRGSLNYHVSLTALWDTTEHIRLLGQVKYEVLGSGITDSPIVDEDSIVTFVIGAVYRF